MAASTAFPAVYQPIHSSVRELLDDDYVAFHDHYMHYIVPDDRKTWDGSARYIPSLPAGGSALSKVASVEDVDLTNCRIRIFKPSPKAHTSIDQQWPALLWFHGGGWAIGGLDSENDFCTYVSHHAQCIVITVDYRLAPEHPYPAAIEDGMEALAWTSTTGVESHGIDRVKVAIGGTSAGGNISAVVAIKAAAISSIRLVFQLLIVPVIDNTATGERGWVNLNAPWLTPARMLWYRRMYLPCPDRWAEWEASPNRAPAVMLAKSPPTWIAVAEQDLLATEGCAFGEQLRQHAVAVSVQVYPGSTHSILALNGT